MEDFTRREAYLLYLASTVMHDLLLNSILKIYGDLVLCAAYTKALEDAVAALKDIAFDIDVTDRKCLLSSPSLFRNWFGIAERS